MGFYSAARVARRRERNQNFLKFMGGSFSGVLNNLQSLGASFKGMGDYTIRSNSIMGQGGGVDSGALSSGAAGGIRISRKEYIQDVLSTTAFANTAFAINPANSALFPWLSNIAVNFQEYKIHGMVMQFRSTSAVALNSTNTALGTVVMATDYNASNPPFPSKSQAENTEYTCTSVPSESLLHGIECDPRQTVLPHLFVSPNTDGTVPAGQDIKLYNLGVFNFITQGSQAVADIGELWVHYDIEFLKPIDVGFVRSALWHAVTTGCGSGGGSLVPFGTLVKTQFNTLECTLSSTAALSTLALPMSLPVGTVVQIQAIFHGVSSTDSATYPAAPTVVGLTPVNCLNGDTVNSSEPVWNSNTVGTTDLPMLWFYKVSTLIGQQATFSTTVGFNGATGVTADLIVSVIDQNFV